MQEPMTYEIVAVTEDGKRETIAAEVTRAQLLPHIIGGESGASNLEIATGIVREIEQVRGVVAELKSAFARNQLDGGVKAAYTHPLYIQAQARLAELHEQMMMVI